MTDLILQIAQAIVIFVIAGVLVPTLLYLWSRAITKGYYRGKVEGMKEVFEAKEFLNYGKKESEK